MAREQGRPRPERVSSLRRAADSWSATALIAVFIGGPFILALLWRSEVSLSIPSSDTVQAAAAGDATAGTGVNLPLKALLLFPWAALAMVVLGRLLRPGPLRHRSWVPFAFESVGRQVIDQSVFGVGPMARWTKSNPSIGLERLVRPPSLDKVYRLFEIADGDRVVVAGGGGSVAGAMRVRPARSGGEVVESDRWSGPVADHVIGRGDTWWVLAERLLGDGNRWKVVRDLNVGREVAPGVVLGVDDELVRGWRIVVPDVVEGELA